MQTTYPIILILLAAIASSTRHGPDSTTEKQVVRRIFPPNAVTPHDRTQGGAVGRLHRRSITNIKRRKRQLVGGSDPGLSVATSVGNSGLVENSSPVQPLDQITDSTPSNPDQAENLSPAQPLRQNSGNIPSNPDINISGGVPGSDGQSGSGMNNLGSYTGNENGNNRDTGSGSSRQGSVNNNPANRAPADIVPANQTPPGGQSVQNQPGQPQPAQPQSIQPQPGEPPTQSPESGVDGSGSSNNVSPGGCAREDGAATGNPGWTCGSESSPNNGITPRDLSALRFHKRQSTSAYVQTMNTWRSKFCLQPLTYNPALEQSAQRQSQDAAAQGSMVETPANGEGTVMARGIGNDFQLATLSWLCEVHTTNLDSCTCAKAYANFQWTERGHYDFLVGKQAGQFGSIGCVYNDAMGGLWTCSLGMK